MITDYVSGNSVTFIKNSKYWGTDPVGPGKGNQLPYLDAVKMLIIPDASTTQAAFRTGKIADLPGLVADDYKTFIKASPELQSQRGPSLATRTSTCGLINPPCPSRTRAGPPGLDPGHRFQHSEEPSSTAVRLRSSAGPYISTRTT